ncbi:AMP-binding domain containing protein [Asbolus verrucosus]|uniref:AMP-binding domain containing protein n=1 Tax=Asbolus verrucosus TaxID=1661398 RepID=A0A482W3D3_ASBVE|nr:AMP-binding domain containing protein [Asbolus verrucosus]
MSGRILQGPKLHSCIEKTIFVEEPSISLIEESLKDVPHKPEIIVFEESQKYSSLSDMMKTHPSEEEFRPVQTNIHETAIMLLTSGTSGQSKVVCHSHYSILRMLDVLNQCGHRAKSVLHLNIFQWLSALMAFTLTFLEGGTRVFCHKMDGEFFLKIIEKYKPTALYLPPNYSYDLTRIQDAKKYDVSSLNCIATGSTPLSIKQFRRMDDLFGNATILFGYGMTELGRIASFNLETDKHLIKSKTASCGKIVPGTGVKVVNPDTNEILGPNQKGEIWVKSPSTMRGYFKREDSDCFDDDGFLRTEDVGYYDEDECFYVVGRITQMIKYQSSYIQPYSIEAVLMEHPAVTDAAVFGIPQGEEQVPAACIVLNSDVSAQEIETFVEERVSDAEKLRGGIAFVASLPKTPSGKNITMEVKDMFQKYLFNFTC